LGEGLEGGMYVEESEGVRERRCEKGEVKVSLSLTQTL